MGKTNEQKVPETDSKKEVLNSNPKKPNKGKTLLTENS